MKAEPSVRQFGEFRRRVSSPSLCVGCVVGSGVMLCGCLAVLHGFVSLPPRHWLPVEFVRHEPIQQLHFPSARWSGEGRMLHVSYDKERRVRLFSRAGTEVVLPLPDAFRVVMARNPSMSGLVDHGEFDGDGAWASRVVVLRIPPLCAASEEGLLRRWIHWSRRPDRDPGEFFGLWKPLKQPPQDEDAWLPRFCRVLEASRVSHNVDRARDPGWKYAETGTGVTRSLIWDAAEGGHAGFEQRLAGKLSEKVVHAVRRHVMEPMELARFQEVLKKEGFVDLATQLG
jgi:hypothetical protein